MTLIYNNCDLAALGEVSVKWSREYEGGEAPQTCRMLLSVTLKLFERSYEDNYALVRQAQTALSAPNKQLTWTNTDTGENYLDQTATLASQNFPEEWGTYFQQLDLSFSCYQPVSTAAQNLACTFLRPGGVLLAFDNILKWTERASTKRFSTLRSQRETTTGQLTVEGRFIGDATQPLATRQAALAARVASFRRELNGAEGTLTYGTGTSQMFRGLVRVESFEAGVDHAINFVPFSFSASYTLFPDESDYATVEATAEERDPQTGELTLAVSGRIEATDEVKARAKLEQVLSAFRTTYGYVNGQQMELSTTPNFIAANADGETFTTLTFSGQWRKWRAGNQAATLGGLALGQVNAWEEGLRSERFDPQRSQRRRSTTTIQAGGVLAAGGSAVTTEAIAARRAGLLASQRALTTRATSADCVLTFGSAFTQTVRVESFNARINQAETGIDWTLTASFVPFPAGSYATVEATAEERDPQTGELTLAVSGRIEAVDEATARTKLDQVLAAFRVTYGYEPGCQQLELSTTPNFIAANEDGEAFTTLAFSGQWRRWRASNLLATLGAVSLGNVNAWDDGLRVERFDPHRPHRRRTTETITAGGVLVAPGDIPVTPAGLTTRRAWLLARLAVLTTQANSGECVLTYGSFTQTVRVESFNAHVNQAETGIEWALSCYYLPWPDPTAYATVEATRDEKDGMVGETFLTVQGKIQAASETLARDKLAAVLPVLLGTYATGQQQDFNSTINYISANEDGATFTELTFSTNWRQWRASNQRATFCQTGHATALSLGQVRTWDDGYKAERFEEHRSQRRHATGSISAGGTFTVDPALPLVTRRELLLTTQRTMKAEINTADGLLVYGSWQQVVRVDDFTARINQAETGIDWTLSASYSLFPNEGGYATSEFTADQRDDVETGDALLSFAGEIKAPNGALARAQLAVLRTATLALYGFTPAHRTRSNTVGQEVSANGDRTAGVPEGMETVGDVAGVTFLRLTFNEEYRRRATGSIVSSKWTVTPRDDTSTGLVSTTYSGTVTAAGASADAALAAATARVLALGANQEASIDSSAFLKSQSWVVERRQLTLATEQELVSVSFSYEYQSRMAAGRAYLEVATQVNSDSFGADSETVMGHITARDETIARSLYQSLVRSLYAGRLLRNETTTSQTAQAQAATVASPLTPPVLDPGVVPAVFRTQWLRLEFSLTVHSPKPIGRATARFAIATSRDFLAARRASQVRGSVYAPSRDAADALLDALFGVSGLALGSQTQSERTEDRDYTPELEAFMKLDFSDAYEDRLTDLTGLLSCGLTETVRFSGTRWAVQPLPYESNGGGGISLVQPAGQAEGSRTVRGHATAATLAYAEAWAWQQQQWLTGDADGTYCPQPPELEYEFEFVPRTDGLARGEDANVRLHKVTFTFGEVLPNYPA